MEPKRQISLWIKEDEYRWLAREAKRLSCSRTELIRRIIQERIVEDERKQQPPQF